MIGYRVSACFPIGRSTAHGRRRAVPTDLLRKNVDSFYTTAPADSATAPESGRGTESKRGKEREECSSFLSAPCAASVRSGGNNALTKKWPPDVDLVKKNDLSFSSFEHPAFPPPRQTSLSYYRCSFDWPTYYLPSAP